MVDGIKMKFLLCLIISFAFCDYANADTLPSTASANVHILEPMAMPGLNRQRIIRVYLPPGYENNTRRYPVLYMHDGQNLFDNASAYAGEWGVDETMEALAKSQGLDVIVVGIDNGQEKRLNELSPWTNKRFGNAEGKQYVNFMVTVLKPYVDKHYRTLADREHTAIMGSSMGGFMSHYAIHQYSGVFGMAGIFSPSYWYSSEVFKHTKQNPTPASAKIYLMMGGEEGNEAIDGIKRMTNLLKAQKHPAENLYSEVVPGGEHNEKFWRSEFPKAVTWLFKKPASTL
jgi:predicted alpha/beta superfamily hydrolase